MKKTASVVLLLLSGLVLTCCNQFQPLTTPSCTVETGANLNSAATDTPQVPEFSRILIDGLADDWANYAIIGDDAESDQIAGSPDLAQVRAFSNDEYFYLSIDHYEEGITDHYDILVDIDGSDYDYQLSVWPEKNRSFFASFPITGDMHPIDGVISATNEIVEIKLPLSAIDHQSAQKILVQTYLGDQIGDVMSDMVPLILDESEMAVNDLFAYWLSKPFEGVVSPPWIVSPSLEGARGLEINSDETYAYVVGEFPGTLWRIDLNPSAKSFGEATVVASDLLIPNDVDLDIKETNAYVSREAGPRLPPAGRNAITRVDLETGQASLTTEKLGQPTNIQVVDESSVYIVDLQRGGLYQLNLETNDVALITGNLKNPFALAIKEALTSAYLVTEPAAAGNYPLGDLLLIDLQNRQVIPIEEDAIWGATGIILNANENIALVTEFGAEGGCSGKISAFNIDQNSRSFGDKKELITGLCGAHDLRLNHSETLLYFVEVEKHALSVLRIDLSKINWT